MSLSDTISAIATPAGAGGIGIIRLSGPQAKAILARMFLSLSPRFSNFRPWTLHRGRILDATGEPLDDVLAVCMPGPRTFTGEDVAEIQCHGGPALLRTVLETTLTLGARLAERGEFTRRAYLNGRMDLTQAEAVAEMIAAPTRASLRVSATKLDGLLGRRVEEIRRQLEHVRMMLCVALDFSEDDVPVLDSDAFLQAVTGIIDAVQLLCRGYERTRCWQEGALVVLAGAVNVGKSSLMNALLGRNRALVTDIPGTTRDFLEEMLDIHGLPVRLTDTAGLRHSEDVVENLGVARSRERVDAADVVALVVDGSVGLTAHDEDIVRGVERQRLLLVWNKADLAPHALIPAVWQERVAAVAVVSARAGDGLDALCRTLHSVVVAQNGPEPSAGELAPNMRQTMALQRALEDLTALRADITTKIPYDICSVRLDSAAAALAEVTGLDTPDALLDRIFATFCIGK
ncbi:MAG: tRNA uridine-5-carboxymethylaminomethyl(34) synthesis GTPase MnmE [Desulfovibrionaceae bacterium]